MTDELTPEQRLENINKKSIELLEQELDNTSFTPTGRVKAVGDALKALAEGIECYERATRKLKFND